MRQPIDKPAVTPQCSEKPVQADWAASLRGLAMAWGIPIAALFVAVFLGHPIKTLIWAAALTWMGVACLANARRCGRTHCFYTGPFFLVMAILAMLHGFEIVPLGAEGWRWLGTAVGVGGGLLWCVPEHLLGRYRRTRAH